MDHGSHCSNHLAQCQGASVFHGLSQVLPLLRQRFQLHCCLKTAKHWVLSPLDTFLLTLNWHSVTDQCWQTLSQLHPSEETMPNVANLFCHPPVASRLSHGRWITRSPSPYQAMCQRMCSPYQAVPQRTVHQAAVLYFSGYVPDSSHGLTQVQPQVTQAHHSSASRWLISCIWFESTCSLWLWSIIFVYGSNVLIYVLMFWSSSLCFFSFMLCQAFVKAVVALVFDIKLLVILFVNSAFSSTGMLLTQLYQQYYLRHTCLIKLRTV